MNPYRTPLLRVIVPFSNDPNRCVHLMAARVLYERKDRSVVWRFGLRARFLRHFESLPDIEHLLSTNLSALVRISRERNGSELLPKLLPNRVARAGTAATQWCGTVRFARGNGTYGDVAG